MREETIEIPVAWGEMDAFGHVNDAVFLRWFESARMPPFERAGVLARRGEGIGPILARNVVDHRAPVTWPDTVRVTASVSRLGNSSFALGYRVTSAARGGELVAEGESVTVMLDDRSGAKVPLDDRLRAQLEAG